MSERSFQAILDFYSHRGYGHKLEPGRRPAVLVIDFSLAFTSSADEFPGGNFDDEIAQTNRILSVARGKIPVCFTTISYAPDLSDASFWVTKVPWLECCVAGSDAVEIDPQLAPRDDEPIVIKRFPSALYETGLVGRLTAAGVDTLIIAGCTTSVCVRATALDAMQHGYRPIVAREAVGDFVPEVHEAHLNDIGARYADVMSVDDICAYLEDLPGDQRS